MTWIRCLTLAAALTAVTATCPSSEWKQFRDFCYWSSDYTLAWEDTRRVCQTMFPGSDLVSIHDLELDAFIAEELLGGTDAWLGLRRSSDSAPWIWTDGTPLNYTNWDGGDPDWYGEGCAIINYGNKGAWTGASCNGIYFEYMCQIHAW